MLIHNLFGISSFKRRRLDTRLVSDNFSDWKNRKSETLLFLIVFQDRARKINQCFLRFVRSTIQKFSLKFYPSIKIPDVIVSPRSFSSNILKFLLKILLDWYFSIY